MDMDDMKAGFLEWVQESRENMEDDTIWLDHFVHRLSQNLNPGILKALMETTQDNADHCFAVAAAARALGHLREITESHGTRDEG